MRGGHGFNPVLASQKGRMKKLVMIAAALAACLAYAAQDVVLDGQREVRDPVQLEVWLEANAADAQTRLAALEASTNLISGSATLTTLAVPGTGLSLTGTGTNVIGTAAGLIDGEKIADDTIDDDSIDFSDVTGADITLTDCGAVTSSGKVTGTELALSATQWFDIVNTTQLVFIAAGVTNVIDADITTP
jgi:hypothetical protein